MAQPWARSTPRRARARAEPANGRKTVSVGMLANRIGKNHRHVGRWARRQQITCFRVYDRDIPEHPVTVDVYQGRAVVYAALRKRDAQPQHRRVWLDEVRAEVAEGLGIDPEQVYLRERHKQQGSRRYGLAQASHRVVVHEGGLRFVVDLAAYHDTGLFLDHRPTRSLVGSLARGRKVLNLFCYTGSFTVYAAAGGARSSLSLDLSHTYLDWTRENLQINGLLTPAHRVERADVLQWLSRSTEQFDLIVCDPPTFSNSKSMREVFDVQRQHPELIRACLRRLSSAGVLYFSSNRRGFCLDPALAAQATDITEQTTPPDYRGHQPHRCWEITSASSG